MTSSARQSDTVESSTADVGAERVEPADASEESARDSQLLDVSVWDQDAAVRAAANRELHADLLRTALRRLREIAIFSGVALSLYLVSFRFLLAGRAGVSAGLERTATQALVAGVVLSALLFASTRVRRLQASFITDLGYAYLFLLCLLLGLIRHADHIAGEELFRQVSPVVVPILAFGALIPAPSRKALAVSLGAAAMDPLALFMTKGHLSYRPSEIALLLASPVLAALSAHQIARVVHRLNEGIVKAREVGSYRLLERLGSGGMAEVWRAQHRMLARPAAVKLIRPQVLARYGPIDAQRLLRLFTREARTTASLGSPHTIQVYDFGITREGAFYYVMELLAGLDLQSLVERFGPQPAERVAALLAQACRSLVEAHEHDFVHRDIKPANIFACRIGIDYDFVKVLDFGLVLDRHPTAEELEDEGRFVGTPSVMAPEMLRYQTPVDARADIYALGCVGYWLLTGRRVFEASTRHDMLVMHAHQKPLRPSKRVDAAIHPGLEAVIMSCLEKNPNRRPQSARALSQQLEGLSFAEPWSDERAREWWLRELPERAFRAPSARS